MRSALYSVHENDAKREPSERIVVVKEGFAIWAFVFHVLWLLGNRCWRMSALFMVLLVAIDQAGKYFLLSPYAVAALQFTAQFWLGCVARDCLRAALVREGYEEIAVVSAENELFAERRFFDQRVAA